MSDAQRRLADLADRLKGDYADLLALAGGVRPKTFEDEWILNYPDGGAFSSGIGTNTFDFSKGGIVLYDGKNDSFKGGYESLGFTSMKRFAFWADSATNLVFQFRQKQTRILSIDQFEYLNSIPLPMSSVTVTCGLPTNFVLYATTSLEPTSATLPTESQLRFVSGVAPVSFPVVYSASLPQWQAFAADYITGGKTLSNPGTAYTAPYIYTPNVVRKTFMVFNLDTTNTLNVNIKGNGGDLTDVFGWIDSPTTGASTAITPGGSALFDVQTRYHYMLMRVSGSATYEAYYLGTSA